MANIQQEEVTPDSLKIQALLERIAQLTAEYENKVVDLRVAFTVASQERDDLYDRLQELEAPTDSAD